jgi:hypothetical protein
MNQESSGMGVDAVEAFEHLRGGFNLDADETRAKLRVGGIEVRGVEDDVVAFAVAVGASDAEAVAGGGESEGEFGDLSAAFSGEFAFEWGLGLGFTSGSRRGWGAALGASGDGALGHRGWFSGVGQK